MIKNILILLSITFLSSTLFAQVIGTGNGGPEDSPAKREKILKEHQSVCKYHIENSIKHLENYYKSKEDQIHNSIITDKVLSDFLDYGLLIELVQIKDFYKSSTGLYCGKEEGKNRKKDNSLILLSKELHILKNEKCSEAELVTPLKLDSTHLDTYIERVILLDGLNEL